MFDANQVMQFANELVDTDAEIIFGVVIDESLDDEMRVTVVATGFDSITPSAEVFKKINESEDKEPVFNPSVNIELDNVDIPTFLKNRNI